MVIYKKKMSEINTTPLVSICIPTYNGAKYIEETIECAINQTYQNIEIIISDDQSTDSTLKICNSFALKDDRITVFQNKKNLGLLRNWCEVIDQTSKESDWIKFLFQDDLMDKTTVEKMITSAINSNVDFVLCNREYIFEKNVSKKVQKGYDQIPKTGGVFTASKKYTPDETALLIKNHFLHNCLGEPPCIFFKKSKYKHSDYPSEFIQLIDYAFILEKIIDNDFYFINEKLIKFRVHNTSQSYKNTKEGSISKEAIHKKILVHYYEKIKICHIILNNPKYNKIKKAIGGKSIRIISNFLVNRSLYKNIENAEEVAQFFKSTELKKDIYHEKMTNYIYLKYVVKKIMSTQIRNKYRI